MKVLLDIKDNKAHHLMEVLKGLTYVKATTISDEKALLMEEIKEAVDNLSLVKRGKLKARPAKRFVERVIMFLQSSRLISNLKDSQRNILH